MNTLKILVIALLPATAMADFDLKECMDLGLKLHKSPASLTVGEADALQLCAAEIMRARISMARAEKEDKAIVRNFLKDGE